METKEALTLWFTAHTSNKRIGEGLEFICQIVCFLFFLLLRKGILTDAEMEDMMKFFK
jgi:hypothetical protein